MSKLVTCPHCSASLKIPDLATPAAVKCPQCGLKLGSLRPVALPTGGSTGYPDTAAAPRPGPSLAMVVVVVVVAGVVLLAGVALVTIIVVGASKRSAANAMPSRDAVASVNVPAEVPPPPPIQSAKPPGHRSDESAPALPLQKPVGKRPSRAWIMAARLELLDSLNEREQIASASAIRLGGMSKGERQEGLAAVKSVVEHGVRNSPPDVIEAAARMAPRHVAYLERDAAVEDGEYPGPKRLVKAERVKVYADICLALGVEKLDGGDTAFSNLDAEEMTQALAAAKQIKSDGFASLNSDQLRLLLRAGVWEKFSEMLDAAVKAQENERSSSRASPVKPSGKFTAGFFLLPPTPMILPTSSRTLPESVGITCGKFATSDFFFPGAVPPWSFCRSLARSS